MDLEINGTDVKVIEADGHTFVTYKGHCEYEAGYFYCPYVPLTMMVEPIKNFKYNGKIRLDPEVRYISHRQEADERGWCLKLFDERYIC